MATVLQLGDRVLCLGIEERGIIVNARCEVTLGDDTIYTVLLDNHKATPDGHYIARGFELRKEE
jgi:hypothetical protein